MSLQTALNQEALDYCPQIKRLIIQSESYEANQMFDKFLRECLSAQPPIAEMSLESLEEFEAHCIELFKCNGWLS